MSVKNTTYVFLGTDGGVHVCVCVCENVAKISLISKFFDFSIIEFVPQETKHILKFPNPQIL